MTDEELKTLVASIAIGQKETDRQFREQREETDRRFRELREETDRRFRETDRQLRELGKQIGGLSNKFGSFTESLALPSAEQLLVQHFGVEAFTKYLHRTVGGEHIEIDGFGFNNGSRNDGWIVEVKSRLDARAVEQTLQIMKRFHSFFPEFTGKALYGLIAAAEATQEAVLLAHREGLYVIRFHGDLMEFVEPSQTLNFTPLTVPPLR